MGVTSVLSACVLDPDTVARTEFSHSMRGYDPHEVRLFLQSASDEIARLQLELEAAGHADAAASNAGKLMQAARTEANVLLGRAQQQAVELTETAEADANRIRIDAGRELETARERSKAMVDETRIQRENSLRSLSEKRQQARTELGQLRASIDELRKTHAEMARLVAEAGQILDSALPAARAAAAAEAPISDASESDVDDQGDALADSGPDAPVYDLHERRTRAEESQAAARRAALEEKAAAQPEVLVDGPDEDEELVPDPRSEERRLAERRQTFAEVGESEPVPLVGRRDRGDIDQLFARIRDSRSDVVAHASRTMQGTDAPNPPNPTGAHTAVSAVAQPADEAVELRARRDDVAARLGAEVALALKRVLADQLNEILDVLRRRGAASVSADELVPRSGDQAFSDALNDLLEAAARLGSGGADVAVEPVAVAVGSEVGSLLRSRVAAFLTDPDRLEHRIRSLYRELRRDRVDDLGSNAAGAAFGLGMLSVLPDHAMVRWELPNSSCGHPECLSNAEAGPMAAGDVFPSGDVVAPTRPGCGCMVVPVLQ
ncbi:MAG: DivIVA domain-containing protein [Candidatus Poriferisodalaceae bacterium]